MVGHQNYWVILQSSENPKRNKERDVNTTGGNTHGLLREVHNFVLFRIYGCVVQRSLKWKYKFCFILLPQKLSVVSEQSTLNHGFWIVIHISMCAEIYFLYIVIDICDMLIVWFWFVFGSWLYLTNMLLKPHVSCIYSWVVRRSAIIVL